MILFAQSELAQSVQIVKAALHDDDVAPIHDVELPQHDQHDDDAPLHDATLSIRIRANDDADDDAHSCGHDLCPQ